MRCGKIAIATALGTDTDTPAAYQPTKCRGVFTVDGDYYTSTPVGATPKKDIMPQFSWVPLSGCEWFTKKYQIVIWVGVTHDH